MSETKPPEDPDDEGDRTVTNIFLVVFFVLIVGGGVWLMNALLDQKKIQDCVAQGRRNCAPIDVPARERSRGSGEVDTASPIRTSAKPRNEMRLNKKCAREDSARDHSS